MRRTDRYGRRAAGRTRPATRAGLPVLVLAAALLVGGCGAADAGGSTGRVTPTTGSAPTAAGRADVPATVEELYERVAKALTRPGMVYHETLSIRSEYPPPLERWGGEFTFERWVDEGRGLARDERRYEEGSQPWRAITAGGGRYIQSRRGIPNVSEAQRCHGGSAVTSLVLGCAREIDERSAKVQRGEYEERPAIVLEQDGVSHGSDERVEYTERLYLDAATYLPVAMLMEGEIDYGEVAKISAQTRYEHEFVPADSLAASFFDPKSFGAGRVASSKPLDRDWGIPVYWLGERYPGEGAFPPLELYAINTLKGEPYEYFIDYRIANSRVQVFDAGSRRC